MRHAVPTPYPIALVLHEDNRRNQTSTNQTSTLEANDKRTYRTTKEGRRQSPQGREAVTTPISKERKKRFPQHTVMLELARPKQTAGPRPMFPSSPPQIFPPQMLQWNTSNGAAYWYSGIQVVVQRIGTAYWYSVLVQRNTNNGTSYWYNRRYNSIGTTGGTTVLVQGTTVLIQQENTNTQKYVF